MAGDTGARRREPFLLGIIGAVIGILLAVVVFGGFGGGLAGASASPSTVAAASPSAAPAQTTAATDAPTFPLITVAPTIVSTFAPTPAPTPSAPSPTSGTNPSIVSFDVPKQEDCTNATAGQITVSWSIRNATGATISIDGPGIYEQYAGLNNEVTLPFGCDQFMLQHTYTLRTVGGNGPAASVSKTVKTRAPSITSFTVGKPDCSGVGRYVGVPMSFEVRAATGAELDRDGAPYSTYNVKATDDIVQYDCTQNDQEWTLTTTGGYGPAATKSIKVSKN